MTVTAKANSPNTIPSPKRCWLALPAALLANALLFYALAGARTAVSRDRIEVSSPVRIALIDSVPPASAAADVPLSALVALPIVAQERPAVTTESIPTAIVSPAPRLPAIMEPASSELPGLTVALPGAADLQAGVAGSGAEEVGPLSAGDVDRPPRKIAGALPSYPRWARRAGLEGTVTLRFVVTAQGTVTDVTIRRIEGDERFGPEAIRPTASWRFEPAVKDGKPVSYWYFQSFRFELED